MIHKHFYQEFQINLDSMIQSIKIGIYSSFARWRFAASQITLYHQHWECQSLFAAGVGSSFNKTFNCFCAHERKSSKLCRFLWRTTSSSCWNKRKKITSINFKKTWKKILGFVSKKPTILNNKNSTTKEPK